MEIGLSVNFSSGLAAIQSDLNRTIEDSTAAIVRSIAEDAPDEMRGMMGTGGTSVKGNPPRVRSGNLSRSLKGHAVSPTEAEIEMAYYAEYLDPFFGGRLDFPFVEEGIDRSLAKSLNEL